MNMSRSRSALSVAALAAICMFSAKPAAAITAQVSMVKTKAAAHHTDKTIRRAPPPPQHQVHRGLEFDEAIPFVSAHATRRPGGGAQQHEHSRHRHLAEMRLKGDLHHPGPAARASIRSIDSIPSYWDSTHLSI
jgi:hypothetical protein